MGRSGLRRKLMEKGKGERDREIWIPIVLILSYRPSNNNGLFTFYSLFLFFILNSEFFERGSSSIFEKTNFVNSASFLPAEKSGREQMRRVKETRGCSRCDFDLGYPVNGYPISCIIPR